MLPLAPAPARAAPLSIPFMTAGEGVGRRTPVATDASDLSGPIAVEDVTLQEDGRDKARTPPPFRLPSAGAPSHVVPLIRACAFSPVSRAM